MPEPRKTPKGERSETDVVATYGRIVKVRVVDGYDESELLRLARDKAYRPESLGDDTRFFPVEISSNRRDAFHTRMTRLTLQNFEHEAGGGDDGKGVGVQHSHDTDELPWGRSLTGNLRTAGTTDEGEEILIVTSTFFTIPDYQPGRVNSNTLIRGIDAGTTTDISVGFHGGEFRCGVCGGSLFAGWFGMWPIECDHIPGVWEEVKDPETGEVVDRILPFAWIDGAHLSEYSVVYDGATPGASVLKARAMADAGALPPERVRAVSSQLERELGRFGIRLRGGSHRYPGWSAEDADSLVLEGGATMARRRSAEEASGTTPARREATTVDLDDQVEDRDADDEEADDEEDAVETTVESSDDVDDVDDVEEEDDDVEEREVEDTVIGGLDDDEDDEDDEDRSTPESTQSDLDRAMARLRRRWAPNNITIGTDVEEAIDALCRAVVTLRDAKRTLKREREEMLEELIKETLREGVRAEGRKRFNREKWERTLRRLPVDEIIEHRDDWRKDARARLEGGRRTRQSDQHIQADRQTNGHYDEDDLEASETLEQYVVP